MLVQRAIKMCPALIFADRRTERVIGRINWLAVSIRTINWDSGRGVLKGTRWLRKWLVLLRALKSTKESQKGSARHKVNIIWAENVNTYGSSPVMFVSRISINILTKRFVFPCLLALFRAAEISLVTKKESFFIKMLFLR